MRPSRAVSSLLFVMCLLAGIFAGVVMQAQGPNPEALGLSIVTGLLSGSFLAASVKVVAQWERMIVLRLGKFQSIADPGLRLLIPIIDTPMFVEMRVQTVPIAK